MVPKASSQRKFMILSFIEKSSLSYSSTPPLKLSESNSFNTDGDSEMIFPRAWHHDSLPFIGLDKRGLNRKPSPIIN